jgi:uracil-DNA glycosylase
MISREHYNEIADKYGDFASWAVWIEAGEKPKSNIGDMSVFNLETNPNLLTLLNPNVVMVGLNFSRNIEQEKFVNFHDKRSQGQDYKIRHAFMNTEFYGAYMTDIIKDFTEKSSGNVVSYLRTNKEFELKNVILFQQEIIDLRSPNPLIIAFGNHVYTILNKYLKNKFRIVRVPHYSNYISQENYRIETQKILSVSEIIVR